MKIAMLNCLNANQVCTGAGCLRAFNSRTKHFAEYGDIPLELVAMARCNGCGKGIDELRIGSAPAGANPAGPVPFPG